MKNIHERLTEETVYLKNEFEDAVMKFEPNGNVWVKFKGNSEFKAKDDSAIVADAVLEEKEISAEQYNNF